MTNDIYHRPAVLPSEAVMLPAMEGSDPGARPKVLAALQTVRKRAPRVQAAQQTQKLQPVDSNLWHEERAQTPVEPLHNERMGDWLGGAALRTVAGNHAEAYAQAAHAETTAVQAEPVAVAGPTTRGALRSVVTGILSNRTGQTVGASAGSMRQSMRNYAQS